MFTKLFRSIVTSSIWAEDADTRVIWVTMLALADFEGIVEASAPGLAQTAGISLERTQYALKKFMEPDEHSRSSPTNIAGPKSTRGVGLKGLMVVISS
jgi:hypothetical protein